MSEKNGAIIETKQAKKVKKGISDKVIIASIVIGVFVLGIALFGVFYYKTNMEAVVTYDGGEVTKAEFTVYYKTFAPMLSYYGYSTSDIYEQVANKAALDELMIADANAKNITITDEDKQAVEDVFNDEEQVASFQEQGIDLVKLKKLYYNDYLISAYIEKLKEEAKDEDVLAYIKSIYGEDADYNQYVTYHILLKTTDSSGEALSDEDKAEVKKKAEDILAKAKKGEDFATLAKENSEDDGTKEEGGKFEMYMDDTVYTEYSDAVKKLKAGEIHSTLVETEAGYHIIKLESIVENGRAKSDTEREEYINSTLDKLTEDKHVTINEEKLKKLVEQITGQAIEEKEEVSEEDTTSTDETTTTEGETTEDTSTTETTEDTTTENE